jgi:hypothetical protein
MKEKGSNNGKIVGFSFISCFGKQLQAQPLLEEEESESLQGGISHA